MAKTMRQASTLHSSKSSSKSRRKKMTNNLVDATVLAPFHILGAVLGGSGKKRRRRK